MFFCRRGGARSRGCSPRWSQISWSAWASRGRFRPTPSRCRRLGWLNGHPSLLPRHRGPLPIAWAIREGDEEIGITFHRMDAELDTGPIFSQRSCPLGELEAPEVFYPKMGQVVGEALAEALGRLVAGEEGTVQPEDGSYESFFGAGDTWLDLSRPASEVHRLVWAWRAFGGLGLGLVAIRLQGCHHGHKHRLAGYAAAGEPRVARKYRMSLPREDQSPQDCAYIGLILSIDESQQGLMIALAGKRSGRLPVFASVGPLDAYRGAASNSR